MPDVSLIFHVLAIQICAYLCRALHFNISVVENVRVFEMLAEAKGELTPNHRASVILQQVGHPVWANRIRKSTPPLFSPSAAALLQTRNVQYPRIRASGVFARLLRPH
jgi:hypothetical protein